MNPRYFLKGIVSFGLLLIFGCAESKIYLVDLKYLSSQAPSGKSVLKPLPRVGLLPFEDARPGKKDLGELFHSETRIDTFILKGRTLSDAVTEAAKAYFVERGYEVVPLSHWDLTPQGMANLPEGLKLAVGGKIEAFWVDAKSGLTITKARYRVKLIAFIGSPAKNDVIRRSVESTPKVEDLNLRFDPEDVGKTLNQTMTESIIELFRQIPWAPPGQQ